MGKAARPDLRESRNAVPFLHRTRTGSGLRAAWIRCYVLLMPFGIGIWELLILLLVLLLVFGPKRLPEMGRQLGKGMREFKDSVTGDSKDDDDDAALPPAEPVAPAAPAALRAARAGHRLLSFPRG